MTSDQTFLTPEGEANLRRELNDLEVNRKPEMARKLKEARAQGDLKENADYHDAKEQLGIIEGRVRHIRETLQNATLIAPSGPSDEVRIGSTVVIREVGEDEDETYRIVGSAEANPGENKISQKSPIGAALLGKPRGRKVSVKTPGGKIKFEIIDIR